MKSPFSIVSSLTFGALLFVTSLLGFPSSFSQQSSPEFEATHAAAVATMASAQATIAAQVSQGITITAGSGNAMSAAIASPSVEVLPTSVAVGGYQQPESTVGNSRLLFVDPSIQIEAGEPNFTEGFDPGPQSGWILEDERWTIREGGLTFSRVATQRTEEIIFLPVLVEGNYEMEMDVSYPSVRRSVIAGQSIFWLNMGEMRGTHPYFNDTQYADNSSGIFVMLSQDLDDLNRTSSSRDTYISIKKFTGEIPNEENIEFESSRVPYTKLFPGKFTVKFSVVNNKFTVERDGAKVTEYIDLSYKPNSDPKALYIEWGYSLAEDYDIKDLLFPVLDNIKVRLLE